MANFPQYSNVEPQIQETLKSRIGNNVEMSKLMPWIRISSAVAGGCIIGSNLQIDSFSTRYGNSTKSGMIGTNFKGQPVEEDFNTRGLRPSPVIENLNIQNGAEGLTRKASFEIKCFSLGQAEKVCKYFLEPRFYVLVEWGWNTKDSYTSLANLREGNNPGPICEMISYNNLGIVKKKRKDSKGHYDGFLGVITGGGISYGDDETHIIAVEITTTGEIPAYLQSHKGTRFVDSGPYIDSSDKFDKEEIKLETAKDESDLGRLYFMKMFNDLPPHKQITPVKNLIEETLEDGLKKWADPNNFLNFDEGVREILSDKLSRGKVQIPKFDDDGNAIEGEYESVKLPTDTNLLSTERYIRLELAWEILNLVSDLKDVKETSCKNPNGGKFQAVSSGISIENTVCRGFKHIFSCDKKKMYIPNTSLPDFGLYKVLTQKEDAPEEDKKTWIELTPEKSEDSNTRYRIKKSVDGRIGDYKFPEPRPIWVIENGKPAYEDVYNETFSFDDTAYKRSPDAYEWGYLKNLYINFDFFCECLTRNGLFMKDVALDILNGLSTASNMYWNFQLSPRGNSKGDETLQVVDWNFIGIDFQQQKDEFKNLLRIQTRGMNSPFLSVNLDLNIPGILANQIMAQRVASLEKGENDRVNGRNPNVRSNTINAAGVEQPSQIFMWGNNFDPIEAEMVSYRKAFEEDKDDSKTVIDKVQIGTSEYSNQTGLYTGGYGGGKRVTYEDGTSETLYGWQYVERNTETGEFKEVHSSKYIAQEKKRKNQIKTNYTSFVNTAGIFPQNNSRKYYEKVETRAFFGRNAKLNNFLLIGTWNDQKLLKQVENGDLTPDEQTTKNPSLLPIKLTATLPGISGFKVGDIVAFTDLPTKFTDKLYQVFQVNQTISDSGWITEIDFRMRNTRMSEIDEVVR